MPFIRTAVLQNRGDENSFFIVKHENRTNQIRRANASTSSGAMASGAILCVIFGAAFVSGRVFFRAGNGGRHPLLGPSARSTRRLLSDHV